MTTFAVILATLSSAAQINALSNDQFAAHQAFSITGTVTHVFQANNFIVADATGRTHIRNRLTVRPVRGDRVAICGVTTVDSFRQEQCDAESIEIVGRETVPAPQFASLSKIAAGAHNNETVVAEGIVTDFFRDDLDENWAYLTLGSSNDFVYVSVPRAQPTAALSERLMRARIRVTGAVILNHCGIRRFVGPHLELRDSSDIKLVSTPRLDTEAPPLDVNLRLSPAAIVQLGLHTLDGIVLCHWGAGNLLLQTGGGTYHRVELSDGIAPPAVGTAIRATGFPETDLVRLNLSDANFKPIKSFSPPRRARTELKDFQRNHLADWQRTFLGTDIRLSGRILEAASPSNGHRAVIEALGHSYLFDVSAVPALHDALTLNASVTVSGCGLVEYENWRPGAKFPKQGKPVLVARGKNDLIRLVRPPWWTPARLTGVVLALGTFLLAVLVWNRILVRLIERKGRLLYREELAHTAAEMRTQERTNLAVELHDALSQNLTGIACQLDAANRLFSKDPPRAASAVGMARRMITRCRTELKNCLWDLRNNTFEDPDAEGALRRTLEPFVGDTTLEIHCGVRRAKISDRLFHDLLCIVRELATNAVRHGRAQSVAVVIQRDGDGLKIDVRDDGCGFDPANHPDSSSGHFGLLGVTERVERLGGTFVIDSARGRGTTATIRIGEFA